MATDKRERQRQNRASKQAELTKQLRKQKVLSTAKRVGIWVVVLIALFFVSNAVWG